MIYISRAWILQQSLKNGARNRKTISRPAITDIIMAIWSVSNPLSARMNGVKRLKFSSAHMARDIPNIKFTYNGSVKRPKSKKATMPLPSRCQKVSFSFFSSNFSSSSLLRESVPPCRFSLLFRSLEQTMIDKTNQHVGTFCRAIFLFLSNLKIVFALYIYIYIYTHTHTHTHTN